MAITSRPSRVRIWALLWCLVVAPLVPPPFVVGKVLFVMVVLCTIDAGDEMDVLGGLPQRAESNSQALRRSTRLSHAPEPFQPGLDYVLVTDCGEPSCYKEAIQMDDSVKWEQAMQLEYNLIIANETWELTELPQGKQTLPCKWVYKKKYTTEDLEPKYKARLVAKGFKQKKGVDFDENFSPIVKMTTLRLVLGLVATEYLELNQMDVKMAFLHGELEADVYMVQPEGFEMESEKPKRAKLVCRLHKALYGLKQGSR
ncbi:hypothetical protein L7F22_046188 [Adiantum nelumboides]|nr:hypothetical protein [Adiantum nelumboides]MCO5592192.1 hypothetical protein [Adiantum nelumboides]